MVAVRWLCAGLCLLTVAVPAISQRGAYDDRDVRDSRYDRDVRDDRNGRDDGYGRDGRDRRYQRDTRDDRYGGYGREDRDRGDRNRPYDRDDRDGGNRWNGGRADADQPLPGGSWAQSCRRSGMFGGTLNAQCKDGRGKWRETQINPRSCPTGRVGNRFGTLACE